MLNIISLGAGVQSSTLALMAAAGEISPMPDAAIFADTGWEPIGVYTWLDWLETQLPFPVHRVSAGNIRTDILHGKITEKGTTRWVSPPLYTLGKKGKGIIPRQCTSEYKIEPIIKHLRSMLGWVPRQRSTPGISVTCWIGISSDEASRMKISRNRWIENRWPLIEGRLTRGHCLEWLERKMHEFPAAPKVERSACIGCPFRSNAEWRALSAAEFEDACVVDDFIRTRFRKSGQDNDMHDEVFLHRDAIPLRDADLGREYMERQYSLLDECEGMCGV